jgi:DNA repair protein RadD
MPTLRPYQAKLKADTYAAWHDLAARGYPNPTVMVVSPTGTGKTVLFSDVMQEEQGASVAIAHRKEIVSQISLALARNGARHRIIGASKTRKACNRLHLKKLKRSYLDPNSKCAVASVDTLVTEACRKANKDWFAQVRLGVGDEAHHFLRENKWGTAYALFPNARWLLVTATCVRADGRGLGRDADGMADVMVLGPTQREAIDMGYLVDYQVAMPGSDVDVARVTMSADGDFNQHQLRAAFHESKRICADTVGAYQRYIPGQLTVVFNVDIEEATKTARAFNDAGIPAAAVSSETDDDMRDRLLGEFERRELLVLCNVDLFGEGFDMPNIEAIIMARHTASFAVYAQQWGRAARLDIPPDWMARWDGYTDEQRRYMISISPKPFMTVVDMVGNIVRHEGPPDCRTHWSLGRRPAAARGAATDAIPTRVCLNPNAKGTGRACAKPYLRVLPACPYCGHTPAPATRAAPVEVDGDITLLDPAACAALFRRKADADAPAVAFGSGVIAYANRKHHVEAQQQQVKLRRAMAWWSGYENAQGRTDLQEQYRRFWFAFGTDVATAQSLNTRDTETLWLALCKALAKQGIDGTVSID